MSDAAAFITIVCFIATCAVWLSFFGRVIEETTCQHTFEVHDCVWVPVPVTEKELIKKYDLINFMEGPKK